MYTRKSKSVGIFSLFSLSFIVISADISLATKTANYKIYLYLGVFIVDFAICMV